MRALMLVGLLAFVGRSTVYAQGTSDFDVGSKIVAMESLWNQAMKLKDLRAVDTILDDAFVSVGPDGRFLTKAEVLVEVTASRGLQVTSESMIVHLHGDTAVVTGIRQTNGVERGKPFVRRTRFVDTWLRKDGLWVSIASLTTLIGS